MARGKGQASQRKTNTHNYTILDVPEFSSLTYFIIYERKCFDSCFMESKLCPDIDVSTASATMAKPSIRTFPKDAKIMSHNIGLLALSRHKKNRTTDNMNLCVSLCKGVCVCVTLYTLIAVGARSQSEFM